jgi:hypothetical protein
VSGDLAARIRAQGLSLRVYYGFGAECVRMHPEDARTLDAATVCGMEVYGDAGIVPAEPEIVQPEEAVRRYSAPEE